MLCQPVEKQLPQVENTHTHTQQKYKFFALPGKTRNMKNWIKIYTHHTYYLFEDMRENPRQRGLEGLTTEKEGRKGNECDSQ